MDRKKHDLKNAVLFLETFPEILRQHLASQGMSESDDLKELMDLLSEKIEVVKASLEK